MANETKNDVKKIPNKLENAIPGDLEEKVPNKSENIVSGDLEEKVPNKSENISSERSRIRKITNKWNHKTSLVSRLESLPSETSDNIQSPSSVMVFENPHAEFGRDIMNFLQKEDNVISSIIMMCNYIEQTSNIHTGDLSNIIITRLIEPIKSFSTKADFQGVGVYDSIKLMGYFGCKTFKKSVEKYNVRLYNEEVLKKLYIKQCVAENSAPRPDIINKKRIYYTKKSQQHR